MLEQQNTKAFLQKDIFQIGLKKFLQLKKLKIQFYGYMLLMISTLKKLLKHFMKKNYKKQINKDLGEKNSLKEKETNYISNAKDMIIHLIAGSIKMILYKNESILS